MAGTSAGATKGWERRRILHAAGLRDLGPRFGQPPVTAEAERAALEAARERKAAAKWAALVLRRNLAARDRDALTRLNGAEPRRPEPDPSQEHPLLRGLSF